MISDTTIRSLVRAHGQIIHQTEQAEVTALTTRDDLVALDLNLSRSGIGNSCFEVLLLICCRHHSLNMPHLESDAQFHVPRDLPVVTTA